MLRRYRLKSSSGFTIPELVLSSTVMVFIFSATLTLYIMASQVWREDLALNGLSRDANIAIERMVRGRPGNTGLQAAKSITSPAVGVSADSVNYTDANDAARSFYYSAGNIYTESGDSILSDVVSVAFSNMDHMLRIEFTVHKYVVDKEIRLSLRTQVTYRN